MTTDFSSLLTPTDNLSALDCIQHYCSIFWKTILSFISSYFFLIGLIFVVALAFINPKIGRKEGPLYPPITSSWMVVINIFFISGLGIKTEQLGNAFLFWQLILFVQFFIFLYYPLLTFLIAKEIFERLTSISKPLLDGVVILGCLPTAITSSVIFTTTCNGNDAAAVVNSIASNLIGIIGTPLLILFYLGNAGNVDIKQVLFKLGMSVLLPFILGQTVRLLGKQNAILFIVKYKYVFKKIKECSILFIVFCALSETAYSGLDAGFSDIAAIAVIVICMQLFTLSLSWILSGLRFKKYDEVIAELQIDNVTERKKSGIDIVSELSFNIEDVHSATNKFKPSDYRTSIFNCENCMKFDIHDRICMLFCSTFKTVAFGLPLIQTIYGNDSQIGMYIVPLLLYHPCQLIVGSFLLKILTKKTIKHGKQLLSQGSENSHQWTGSDIQDSLFDSKLRSENVRFSLFSRM